MTERWPVIPLADACEVFTDGDWVETKDQSPSGIRLIQTGNIGKGEFKNRPERARHISSGTFDALRCTEVLEGDCLVSRLPDPVGRSCIIPQTGEKMITAVDCTIIRFRSATILPEFFNYYSQSKDYLEAVDRHCTGATRRRISRRNLGTVPIPSPPRSEQERIVAILDEAFAAIATAATSAEKNLANALELFESELNRVFSQNGNGWVETTLASAVDEKCSLSYGIVQPGKDYPSGLPVVRPTDMVGKIVLLAGLKRIDPNLATAYGRTALDGGEILLCVRGSTGTISIATQQLAGANVTRGIVPVRFDPSRVTQAFGYYLLLSDHTQKQIRDRTYGAALMQINIRDLRQLSIRFPRLRSQQAIVEALDGLSEETKSFEAICQRKLALLAELKQSILHKAFTGELTADFNAADVALSKGEV